MQVYLCTNIEYSLADIRYTYILGFDIFGLRFFFSLYLKSWTFWWNLSSKIKSLWLTGYIDDGDGCCRPKSPTHRSWQCLQSSHQHNVVTNITVANWPDSSCRTVKKSFDAFGNFDLCFERIILKSSCSFTRCKTFKCISKCMILLVHIKASKINTSFAL